jgi:hypothetical protein
MTIPDKLAERTQRIFLDCGIAGPWLDHILQGIPVGFQQAQSVQCIGMRQPIPLADIYQSLRCRRGNDTSLITFESVFDQPEDSIIFAGPGRGKTTVLQYSYTKLTEGSSWLPILFTLRTETVVEDLAEFVTALAKRKQLREMLISEKEEQENKRDSEGERKTIVIPPPAPQVFLLVDGYDEIDSSKRAKVSTALALFQANAFGTFILTCRTSYIVYNLQAVHYFLEDFTYDDAVCFVNAFAKSSNLNIDGRSLVSELISRRLEYFALHPLMLCLVMVIRTDLDPRLPTNSIALLRRAIEILAFRWDRERRVVRHSSMGLEGEIRVNLMMRIAYDMRFSAASDEEVRATTKKFLTLQQRSDIDSDELITEICQFYGLLSETGDGNFQFVHKTIHDYLAARFSVEGGLFVPNQVADWEPRAAYAACLVPDATQSLICSLRVNRDTVAFSECLLNTARFDPRPVARAVLEKFEKYRPYSYRPIVSSEREYLTIDVPHSFFSLASTEFLQAIVEVSSYQRRSSIDVVLGCACVELQRRSQRISDLDTCVRLREYFTKQYVLFDVSGTKCRLEDLLI